MPLNKINFQPNQLLMAEHLNDMQQNMQIALTEDEAKTFEVEIEILEESDGNNDFLFVGLPNKTLAEIAEAANNGKNVQASINVNIDGEIAFKMVGYLTFCLEGQIALFYLDKAPFYVLGSESMKDIALIIAKDEEEFDSQEFAIAAFLPTGDLEFTYSDGSSVQYDPNRITYQNIAIPSIDTSLTKLGYAADARTTGTKINTINNTLTTMAKIPVPTTEDEGKILKIVNGVPTWVSP
jgi:hypothetical protein